MAQYHFYLNYFSCAISFWNFENIQEKIHLCIFKNSNFKKILVFSHGFSLKNPQKSRFWPANFKDCPWFRTPQKSKTQTSRAQKSGVWCIQIHYALTIFNSKNSEKFLNIFPSMFESLKIFSLTWFSKTLQEFLRIRNQWLWSSSMPVTKDQVWIDEVD